MSDRMFAIEVWLDGDYAYTNYDNDEAGAKEVAKAIAETEGRVHAEVEVRVYEMTLLTTYGTGR